MSAKSFHGFPVLGKVEISSNADREQLMSDYYAAQVHRTGTVGCFWPRHGIRAEYDNGRVIEHVICFQCGRSFVYEAQDVSSMQLDTTAPPIFSRLLTQAGIAIVPDSC